MSVISFGLTTKYSFYWGAVMAQCWERSPSTNVAPVWFPDPASYVGWVCFWFSTFLREVLLRALQFSPLLKNQHFHIPIRFWNTRTVLDGFFGLLDAPWVNKLQITNYNYFFYICRKKCRKCWLVVRTSKLHWHIEAIQSRDGEAVFKQTQLLPFAIQAHETVSSWKSSNYECVKSSPCKRKV